MLTKEFLVIKGSNADILVLLECNKIMG